MPVIAQQATSAQRPSSVRPNSANVVNPQEQGCSSALPVDDLEAALVYAKQYARHFCRYNPTIDTAQVESSALQGALDAWNTYDASRGAAWRTYLTQKVRWAVSKGMRPRWERSHRKFVEEHGTMLSIERLGEPQGNTMYADGAPSANMAYGSERVPDPRVRFEIQFECRELLNVLPEMERWVLIQRYYQGCSLDEIASLLGGLDAGWSRPKVWRIEQKALGRLRLMLEA